jgi:hypothetical protein
LCVAENAPKKISLSEVRSRAAAKGRFKGKAMARQRRRKRERERELDDTQAQAAMPCVPSSDSFTGEIFAKKRILKNKIEKEVVLKVFSRQE